MYPILSSEDLRKISKAISEGRRQIEINFDLNFSNEKEKVELFENGIIFQNKKIEIPQIREDDKSCYLIVDDKIELVQYSSGEGIYKLVPTSFRPIMQISGTSMHKQEFIERIERSKLYGKILDSGTGLGYTAIMAGKSAKQVVTIEIDEQVIEMQKINPFSQWLFKNKKIERIQGDLTKEIKKFQDREFNFIILDGGTPRSSGDFFSPRNYEQVFRVLRFGGKLYHYVPNYHINRGEDFAGKISNILKKVGFKKIIRDAEGSYLVAWK